MPAQNGSNSLRTMRKRRLLRWLGGAVVVMGLLVMLAWNHWVRARLPSMPTLGGMLSEETLEFGGRQRSHLLYLPARRADKPPLVLVLHGSTSNAAEMREYTAWEFEALADVQGFVVAYPNGVDRVWNDCVASNHPEEEDPTAAPIDDVGYLLRLIAHLQRTEGIDPARVFAMGYSNGAGIAMRVAMEAPGHLHGIGAVATTLPKEADMHCKDGLQAIPFLLMSGTADPFVSYDDGTITMFGMEVGVARPPRQALARFLDVAGYGFEPVKETVPDTVANDGGTVERLTWRADGGPEIVHYVVHGGGHNIPHPTLRFGRIVGPTNGDINAPREIWSFFSRIGKAGGE